jgi:uncharacterized membrane protein
MNFGNFITSNTGLIHFISSIVALLLGTLVLVLPKGTSKHKTICFGNISKNAKSGSRKRNSK